MYAATWGYFDIVTALLERGADVNVQDYKGNTALLHTVRGENPGIVSALLRNGEDTNLENTKSIVAALLENGADVDVQNKKGKSALMYTVQEGHLEFKQLLCI